MFTSPIIEMIIINSNGKKIDIWAGNLLLVPQRTKNKRNIINNYRQKDA
jgi:hypothetical protein